MADRRIGDTILDADRISLSFGGIQALNEVSLAIREHEILAIIGPNGAGKTSLLNVINGFYHPQRGTLTWKGVTRRRMRPHEAAAQGIARTFQNVALFRGMTSLDNIMTGRLMRMRRNLFWQALHVGPAATMSGRPPRRSSNTAPMSSASSTFSRSRRSARCRSASSPMACKSASNWPGPWQWSRNSCCSTSRWPG